MCSLERNARTFLWFTNPPICQSVNLSIFAASNRKSFVAPNCKIFSICVRCSQFCIWICNEQTSSYHIVPPSSSSTTPAPSPDTANGWQIFPHIFGCMHFWPQANGLLQLSFSCCCSFFCCYCCLCTVAASALLFFLLLKLFFQLSRCIAIKTETEKALDFHRSPKVADDDDDDVVLAKVINLRSEWRAYTWSS